MKRSFGRMVASAGIAVAMAAPFAAVAEDIDLFAGAGTGGSAGAPNVLFVIDNTDNWSRNDQKWAFGKQGESELRALKQVVATLDADVNIGLMLFNDSKYGGGAYIRFAMRPMSDANKLAFAAKIDEILANFNNEGAGSSAEYSSVLFDAFKYFGGYTSPANAQKNIAGTPLGSRAFGTQIYSPPRPVKADPVAYEGNDRFAPPGTITADCARNYVIFIGNGFPNGDDKDLPTYLANIGGDTRQIPGVTGKLRYADEWARYLFKTDANAALGQQNISTYTIDVFNEKPDDGQASLLNSMARVGGGKYFAARDEDSIVKAIREVLIEIQSTDSVFASAALPVSANSRAENDNLVFLGLFRPDPKAKPRWFGNFKRYSLKSYDGYIDLADQYGARAINPQTGFFSDCSVSYWTTDSGSYWKNGIYPSAASRCTLTDFDGIDVYSDTPDGAYVEKGGVAEILRKGNNPPTTNATPTWQVNRKMLTISGSAIASFTTGTSGLPDAVVDYISGKDLLDENLDDVRADQVRSSVHGDVIHSRLLPITYAGTTGTVVYYGANDGTLRAVNAEDGRERWALVAPEFFPRLKRLLDNEPLVKYPATVDVDPPPTPKDYSFDGPIGAYQTADAATAWIFPAMRRGGRTVYGLDVSNPDSPALLWRKGCPNLDDDTGCSAGFEEIGQTWSTPVVAFTKGYDGGSKPLIVLGGGYDRCEDEDVVAPDCGSAKGRTIFVLDAQDGTVLRRFAAPGMRSIVGDVSLIDIDYDGFVDFGYAADTGGNVWRISFVEPGTNAARAAADWTITRAAYTASGGRKFLHTPALLATKGQVYLALGSGDREHPLMTNYPYTDVKNRFYVYLDDPQRVGEHDLDAGEHVIDASDAALCTAPGVVPGGEKRSWFIDLDENGQGEQTVTTPLIAGGLVVFSTNRPTTSTNLCSFSLGEARGYWLNLLNGSGAIGVEGSCGGLRSSVFTGGGLPPSPVRGVVRIDGRAQNVIISAVQRDGSVSSSIGGQKLVLPIKSRRHRIYWYQEGEN